MVKYRFVVWGCGKRAKMFADNGNLERIVAFIDNNENLWGADYKGVRIISYAEYRMKYSDYDIVISPLDNQGIRQILVNDKIDNFSLLEDCPPEIVGYGGKIDLNELPIPIDYECTYAIYGLNAYAFFLREYIYSKYSLDLQIIPDEDKPGYEEKYSYIKTPVNVNTIILNASRYPLLAGLEGHRVVNMFDFAQMDSRYEHIELKKFKDAYIGQKCFIVATGPSLRVKDLDALYCNGWKCFGVNRVYLSFGETKWRPDFFVATDDKIISDYWEEIKNCDCKVKFISDILSDFSTSFEEGIFRVHNQVLEYEPFLPCFSDDIVKTVYDGRTVVYICLQIAAYMGFKEIYLLGVDHNYVGGQSNVANHFHKDYYSGCVKPNRYFNTKSELAFQSAAQYAKEHGIKIYNATRGGKLEIFERVEFDSLFNE